MSDKLGQIQSAEEKIADLEAKIGLLRGSVKVDSKQHAQHPTITKGLGDYAEIRQLIAGDYAFVTRFGKVARIEHKTWDGLIGDIGTRRVTDQLRRQEKDISIILIEGWITTTHGGAIRTQTREYIHRPFTWLWNYLLSIQLAGTYIYLSPNEYITSKIILATFDYLNKEEHTALGQRQRLISMHPGLTPKQISFSSIPMIGNERAKSLDEYFHHSLYELCIASVEEMAKIEIGEKKILLGEKKATFIHKYVRNLI